jgi:hypothetical protein
MMPPAASSAPAPISCGPTGDPVNASGAVGVVLAGLTGTVEVELADDDGLLGLVDVELADDDGDDGLECGVVGVVHGVLGWLLVPVGLG